MDKTQRKFLLAHTHSGPAGPGIGRAFGTSDGPLTEQTVKNWEASLRQASGYYSVFITNVVELEG